MRYGEAPLSEITLRKYESPTGKQGKEELLRKILMSLGLLQPGDGREGIVQVFLKVLELKESTTEEIFEKLDKKMAISGIRRHLARLEEINLVMRKEKKYRLVESNLSASVDYAAKKMDTDVKAVFERIEEYAKKFDGL